MTLEENDVLQQLDDIIMPVMSGQIFLTIKL